WGGADAQFLGLLTYRETLDRRAAGAPVIALVQAEGVLDILEDPGTSEMAGPLAERIRMAAGDRRVRGVIVRISATSASGEALTLLTRAAEEARRTGTPVGFSFGPLVPANAATLKADMPVLAAGSALLVNPAPGSEAAALAREARFPWRAGNETAAAEHFTAELALLKSGAALAAIGTDEAPAGHGVREEHANPLPSGSDAAMWRGGVGTLLELKDRLSSAEGSEGAQGLLLASYEPRQPSLWERTVDRFDGLWRWMSGWVKRPSAPPQTAETG
ncbi:MAG: hypothetical protein ACLFV8_07790, partial [Alphaproteobacteria bacterium]